MIEELKQLAKQIHNNALGKGFYDRKDESLFQTHQLYEIAKEIAEFHEAYKKDKSMPGENYIEDYAEEIGKEKDVFEALVKDTYQDELADIVIRCLDYLEYQRHTKYLKEFATGPFGVTDYSISDFCFDMTNSVLNLEIGDVVINVLHLSDLLNVDLLWHIKAKMAYNATRGKLHGKNF
jgi:hypothetical protein